MYSICIGLGKTNAGDFSVVAEDGFPIAYIGRGSYTGNVTVYSFHKFSRNEGTHLIYIGRYTSIGGNIRIFCDLNHDYRSLYMGVIPELADLSEEASVRERIGQTTKRMDHRGMILIGNDVWIGNDVTLISDVTIGNGAVIGAGSVVAKDIPPYTIWGGNPAVCIGRRFSPEIAMGLQKISWWEWTPSRLMEAGVDMKGEPDAFVSKYVALSEVNLHERELFRPDNDLPVYIMFLDNESEYPTYGDIIEQFITRYNDRSANLIIYYYEEDEQSVAIMETLSGVLSKLEGRVNIFTTNIDPEDDEFAIEGADFMIIGRDIRNIQRISYAFKHDIKCICGANSPIFMRSK